MEVILAWLRNTDITFDASYRVNVVLEALHIDLPSTCYRTGLTQLAPCIRR